MINKLKNPREKQKKTVKKICLKICAKKTHTNPYHSSAVRNAHMSVLMTVHNCSTQYST